MLSEHARPPTKSEQRHGTLTQSTKTAQNNSFPARERFGCSIERYVKLGHLVENSPGGVLPNTCCISIHGPKSRFLPGFGLK